MYRQEVEKTLVTTIQAGISEFEGNIEIIEKALNYLRLSYEEGISSPSDSISEVDTSDFKTENNEVLYSSDSSGASLYYIYGDGSEQSQPDWDRVGRVMEMESSMIKVQDSLTLTDQIYFNSSNRMTLIYPGIPNLNEVFDPHTDAGDYLFYYLADETNNPMRESLWTPVYVDPARAGWVLSYITPIYNGDVLEGVLGADITIKTFTDRLTSIDTKIPYTILITEGENIISYNDELNFIDDGRIDEYYYSKPVGESILLSEEYSLKNILNEEKYNFISDLLSKSEGHSDFIREALTVNDEEYFFYKSSSTHLGWSVICIISKEDTKMPLEAANQQYRPYLIFANILLVLILIILLLITSKLANQMSNALIRPLNLFVQKVKDGDLGLGPDLDLKSDITEIILLQNTFNDLQQNLNKHILQLVHTEKEKEKEIAANLLLRELSYKDMLTGVYNRRRLEEELDRMINQSYPNHQAFSVILMDIDYFKKINDTYGHDKGDEVLKSISRIIQKELSPDEIFGRWGGEEFLIISAKSEFASVVHLGERIRTKIYDAILIPNHPISISLGIAEICSCDDKYSLFKRVDELLYKAKNSGRNRVVASDECNLERNDSSDE